MYQNIIRIIGLFLDIIGTCIITFTVLTLQTHFTRFRNLEELERELDNEFIIEREQTVIGLAFILVGFLLVLFSEVWDLGIINPTHPREIFGL